jgi:hypothetical protein
MHVNWRFDRPKAPTMAPTHVHYRVKTLVPQGPGVGFRAAPKIFIFGGAARPQKALFVHEKRVSAFTFTRK